MDLRLAVRYSTELHFRETEPVPIRQFDTPMLVDLCQVTSTATFLMMAAVPEVLVLVEMEDVLVDEESAGRNEVVEAVVEVEIVLLRMADPRRLQRSLMRRWKITGVRSRTALLRLQKLQTLRKPISI